jgi:hypothetical protein
MHKHADLQDKLIAALNFDMTGANTATTASYLRIKMTPDGRASYLNDLVASLLRYVDQIEVRTNQGANAVFNYRMAPLATITSGSDHTVFLAAGVPTMQFNHWPDNFYHSSADRIVHVDPTELKRVAIVAASAFAYLANADVPEARDLAWEAAGNGAQWIAEVGRQSVRLLGSDPAGIHEQHKAAQTKVEGAFGRASGSVASVRTLAASPEIEADIKLLTESLAVDRTAAAKRIEAVYQGLCAGLKVKPVKLAPTTQELEYARLIPRRKYKVYGEEAQKASQAARAGQPPAKPEIKPAAAATAQAAAAPCSKPAPQTARPGGGRGMGFASSSTNYFIDGKRSILEIYNAVRAECGNLQVGSQDGKYAYVLGSEYPDVELETVAGIIRNLEKSGVVEIVTAPKGKR